MTLTSAPSSSSAPDTAQLPAVHVCVATEQVLANVLPLRMLEWGQMVLVVSDHIRLRQGAKLDQFVRWIEGEAHRRGLPAVQAVRVVNLHDKGLGWSGLLAFARNLTADILHHHPGQPIDLNLTGGTKLMTQAFSTALADHARLVYCNTPGETLEVLDPEGNTPALALRPDLMTLRDYLSVQGFEVLDMQSAADTEWLAGVQQRLPLTLALVHESARLRMTPAGGHKRLLNVLHGAASDCLGNFRRAYQPQAELSAPHNPVWRTVVQLLQDHHIAQVLDWPDQGPTRSTTLRLQWCNEAAVTYLAGGYLEEYAFLCAHALGLPPSQIGMNVRLRLRDSRLPDNFDYQELDLAIVWRNRLWVLECKAGVQLHNGSGQDILNKLDKLKARVGGALGEGWLLTLQQLKINFDMHLPVLERAKDYGIRLVNGASELQQLSSALAKSLQVPREHITPLGTPPAELSQALQAARDAAWAAKASHD